MVQATNALRIDASLGCEIAPLRPRKRPSTVDLTSAGGGDYDDDDDNGDSEEKIQATRKRAKRNSELENDIASAIAAHALVPDFLKHKEHLNSKLDANRIKRKSAMWRDIYSLTRDLSFTQSEGKRIMTQVAAKCKDVWPRELTPDEAADWVPSASKQFRAMARHVAQSLVKKKQLGL